MDDQSITGAKAGQLWGFYPKGRKGERLIFLAVIVLFGAIYYYTFAVTEQVDKRADHTDDLLRELTAKIDLLAKERRQANCDHAQQARQTGAAVERIDRNTRPPKDDSDPYTYDWHGPNYREP